MIAEIPIPIYDGTLIFTDEKVSRAFAFIRRRHNIDIRCTPEEADGMTLSVGKLMWVVRIPDLVKVPSVHALRTMVHEAGHVVRSLSEQVGIEDEEAFCYALDWIYGEMLNVYFPYAKKTLDEMEKKKKNVKRKRLKREN